MPTTVLRYIWDNSRISQIILVVMTLVSFPFLYVSLELPKIIVNQAIGGEDSEGNPTETFTVLGYEFTQVEFLLVTAFGFLTLVLVNGAFKFRINTAKGILAERLLRRLRTMLLDRVLNFPLPRARKFNSGELVSMITAETEPLGGFFGDAIVVPLFQGGTLLTIVAFMFAQNWIMGAAALTMVPIQGYLVPKIQAKINDLAVQRVKTVRQLSNNIQRVSGNLEDIHANGSGLWVRSSLSEMLGRIFVIRYQIYRWKFLMKFLNNFLNQVTPFFFYSIGGYLVIQGELTLGALVAALTAYKDLTAPWKELLTFYQRRADAKLKYSQLRDAFDGALDPDTELQLLKPNGGGVRTRSGRQLPDHLRADIRLHQVTVVDEHGTAFLTQARALIPSGRRVLIHGGSGAAREVLAQVLSRLILPSNGEVTIETPEGAQPLSDLPRAYTGRHIGLVAPAINRLEAHLGDVLMAGLRHRPPSEALLSGSELSEALGVGAVPYSPIGDWVDYAHAGINNALALESRAHEVLAQVGLEQDALMLGLDQTVTPESHPELTLKIMTARGQLQTVLKERGAEAAVRTFDFDRYNNYASVGENILFGVSHDPAWQVEALGQNAVVWGLLESKGLADAWMRLGLALAKRLVALLEGLSPDHPLYQQFDFVDDETIRQLSQLPAGYAAAETVISLQESQGPGRSQAKMPRLNDEEETVIRQLPFHLIVQRHRLGLIDDAWRERLVAVRHALHASSQAKPERPVEVYDPAHYAEHLTVGSNILFGRIAHGQPEAEKLVKVSTRDILDHLGAITPIIGLALSADLSRFGYRLGSAQWQRLALGRALMKRPDLLILQDAFASLEIGEQQKLLTMLSRHYPEMTVLWLAAADPQLEGFDRVGRLSNGRIFGLGADEVEDGEDDTVAPQRTPEDEEAELLGALPLFAALDMAELRRLSIGSRQVKLAVGDVLMREGEPGEAAYVVLSGTLTVSRTGGKGGSEIVGIAQRGEIIGEIALFADVPRTATLTAREPVQLLELRWDVLEQLVVENPHLGLNLLRTLAARLAPRPAVDTTKEAAT